MTTFYGTTIDNGRVYITATLAGQSQSGNYSTIQWYFGWDFLGAPSDRELDNGLATLDGTARYNVPGRVRDYPLGTSGTGLYQVASGSYIVGHDANGYHTTTVSGHLTGYSGANSTMSTQSMTLPRIPKAPSTPGTPALSLAASSGPSSRTINAAWSAPSDNGGVSVGGYAYQVAADAGFTSLVANYVTSGAASASATVPAYATPYYVRVAAVNSIGQGPWSATASITTGADVPTAPAIGAVSAIGPINADVSWSAPSSNNGSALTGYDVQWTTDSTFATGLVTSAVGTSASPYTMTSLNPATTYYVRVRANNAIGASGWSGSLSFLTLPSVHVPNAGGTAWVDAIVYMADASATNWVPVQIKTPSSDGTAWV
jgi:hypothetical protein